MASKKIDKDWFPLQSRYPRKWSKVFSQLWSVINPFSGSLNCLWDSHRDQHSQKSIGLLHARTSALLSLLKCLWTLGDPVKHDAEALWDPESVKHAESK